MLTTEQETAAQGMLNEIRRLISSAWAAQAFTVDVTGGSARSAWLTRINQASAWADRASSELLPQLRLAASTPYTFAKFVEAAEMHRAALAELVGDVGSSGLFSYLLESAAATASDVKAAAKSTVAVVSAGLPWVALLVGALAVLYVAKAVRP